MLCCNERREHYCLIIFLVLLCCCAVRSSTAMSIGRVMDAKANAIKLCICWNEIAGEYAGERQLIRFSRSLSLPSSLFMLNECDKVPWRQPTGLRWLVGWLAWQSVCFTSSEPRATDLIWLRIAYYGITENIQFVRISATVRPFEIQLGKYFNESSCFHTHTAHARKGQSCSIKTFSLRRIGGSWFIDRSALFEAQIMSIHTIASWCVHLFVGTASGAADIQIKVSRNAFCKYIWSQIESHYASIDFDGERAWATYYMGDADIVLAWRLDWTTWDWTEFTYMNFTHKFD